MILCKELNKEFTTKKEMYRALVERKNDIISLKKKNIYKSSEKGGTVNSLNTNGVTKGIQGLEAGFIYPAISNTYFMDSHKDVHITDSMNKTVEQQQGKVHYTVNHNLEVGKIISYPKDVEMLLKNVEWKDLGENYIGKTQVLLFKTNISSYSNSDAVEIIKNRIPVQGSIRMQYVKMTIAINDPEFKDEYAEYQKHIDLIANKEEAEEEGYFFPVYELKIVDEGAMVIKGSNRVTEIQYNDPSSQDNHKSEPSLQDTQFDVSKAIQKTNINL